MQTPSRSSVVGSPLTAGGDAIDDDISLFEGELAPVGSTSAAGVSAL